MLFKKTVEVSEVLLYNNKMRKTEKVRAIVIKSTISGEKDRILKLLCSDGRVINAVSKGAVSLKGKNRAGSMLFCLGDYVLTYTGDMAYVSSSEVVRLFSGLQKNVVKMTAASYMAVMAGFTEISDMSEGEAVYRLVGHSFILLEKSDEGCAGILTVSFALKLFGITGIAPGFDRCVSCGEESEYYFFSSYHGGVVCPVCVPAMADETLLTKDEARYLKLLMYIDVRKIPDLEMPDIDTVRKLLSCVNGYSGEYFHKKNNSYDMLIGLLNT